MSLRIAAILSLLQVCKAYTPTANNAPMLTHASMDVGNIISIVIPESPDENINVEQLTGEFRQQLERIKKQSRASKVEHGLVTLKEVLPEMSREEKRKTLPLIRRVLHGRRVANSGSMKNRTREAQRLDKMSRSGKLLRGHAADITKVKKIFRNHEEPVNHELVTTQNVELFSDVDEYRRATESANPNRGEEEPRQDTSRRNDQIRREQFIHYDEQSQRDDRAHVPEEYPSPSKIAKSGFPQAWNNQNWEDRLRDTQTYPESTTECNDKFDRMLRQNEPRYPVSRQDGTDNTKRHVKDGREYKVTDMAGFIKYAKEYDMNEASNPDCDNMKRNNSGLLMEFEGNRDVAFDKRRFEAGDLAQEDSRGLQKIFQGSRGHFERSNASRQENVVNESIDAYSSNEKEGQRYLNDFRRFASIRSNSGNRLARWDIPNYDDHHSVNASDDTKAPGNLYEIFAGKEINPGVAFMQPEQSNFPSRFENEPKTIASQHFGNYHGNSRILRFRRASNKRYGRDLKNTSSDFPSKVTRRTIEASRLYENLHKKFDRLLKFFDKPESTVPYANKSMGPNEKSDKMFTKAAKLTSTVSSSMVEPTTSTVDGVAVTMKSTTNLQQVQTTGNHGFKPLEKS